MQGESCRLCASNLFPSSMMSEMERSTKKSILAS